MARLLGIFALVVLVIGFFAYIDIHAYKLGFAPPSQRVTEHNAQPIVVSPHQAYRQPPAHHYAHAGYSTPNAHMQFAPHPHEQFGAPNTYFYAPNPPDYNSSFKAEFGAPRE